MDFFGQDDPTDEEQQQALIAALRKQQGLGVLGQLSGDKVLGSLGQNLQQGAQQGQQLAERGKDRKLQLKLEAQKDADLQQHRSDVLGEQQREFGQRQQTFNLQRQMSAEAKAERDAERQAASKDKDATRAEEQDLKERELLGKDITEAHGRGSELVKNTGRRNASQRILGSLLDEHGNVRKDLNTQQAHMFIADVQAMMGASQAEAALKTIVPESLLGNVEGMVQFITGKQRPAHLESLLGPFVDMAKGEEATIAAQNRGLIQQELVTHAPLIKRDKTSQNMLKVHGVGMEDLDPETLLAKDNSDPAEIGARVRAESARRRQAVALIDEARSRGITDPKAIKAYLASKGIQ